MKEITQKRSEISFLYDISQMLTRSPRIEKTVWQVLFSVCEYIGLSCCLLNIVKRNTTEIIFEEFYGLDSTEKKRIKELMHQNIIQQVIESGEAMLLPKINHNPQFIKSSKDLVDFQYEISLICVPIKSGAEIIGTFGFSMEFYESDSFKIEFRLLTIIASMVAQTVHALQDQSEEIEALKNENKKLHNALEQPIYKGIIGNSSKIQAVNELISRVARTNATVLLLGESGVGKELFANAIHESSNRKGKVFIKVNCSALPETLIETELFGHERGAFTGADSQRKGRFELAHEGTIFLDEIGDLPFNTQVKLLRILQEREFERIGGSKTLQTDVRVIAATNRNLQEMIKKGEFREDLYYRLNIFPVNIPSLRERNGDIPLLINAFIEKFNKKHGLRINRISTAAIDLLMLYHWPGNVRELENCIERSMIMCTGNVIHSTHLPPTLQTAQSTDTNIPGGSLDEILGNLEKQIIIDNLIQYQGNVTKVSECLKTTERIMRLRIEKYGIEPKRFKIK